MQDCLFCKIVDGIIPCHKIYETETHLGILDINPSVKAQSLVIPKSHYDSYVFSMDEFAYLELMKASRDVATLIDHSMNALRTCMVMEGMEVNHAHIKLYPIYIVKTAVATDFADLSEYAGYITTLHGKRMNDSELEIIARTIKGQ